MNFPRNILAAAALVAFAASAEYISVDLQDGIAAVPAGKVVAISAVSTNASGTATFKRVTPLTFAWTETVETAITNTQISISGVTNHSVRISRATVPHSYSAPITNDVCSLAISSGRATTNLTGVAFLPGDLVIASNILGKAVLVIER